MTDQKKAYLSTLDALSRMRDKCQGEISLPQLCVVGDQTSGKSSLLHCLTKVPFPVKAGICTRAPTVVQCRRADEIKCEIRRGSEAEFEEIDEREIENAIAKAQKNLLDKGSKDGPKVTKSEITLRMEGPDQMDLQIVDLPGIIHNGDGASETKELIEKYIASNQTLILLVSEAKQDKELIAALQLAEQHDPTLARTLQNSGVSRVACSNVFSVIGARNIESRVGES